MIPRESIELFNKVSVEIPAYKSFLKTKNFNQSEIQSDNEFLRIPISDKKSYLQNEKHKDLIWPKSFYEPMIYSSTSGSTGIPYYFPRNDVLAQQASFMAENFLNNSSYGEGRTLLLVGFGMGVWIGGVFTIRQFEIAAERNNLALSILPVGYNKKEMYKALKILSPEYDQTIIAGYPPFIKEIVDESEKEGISLPSLNVRVLFAAESFTETFRNYISEKAGIKNPELDTMNVYGTADIGAMAYETPLSIIIRRLALDDPLLFRDLFGQFEKTPTLAQYNEKYIQFEEIDGRIILTGNGVIPLVRYSIGDNGGVRDYTQIRNLFKKYGIDLDEKIKNLPKNSLSKKDPFVFVYERSDMSVLLHGIIIYPEFIKEALLHKDLQNKFTERFTMSTKNDIKHNQFLSINLELQSGVKMTDLLRQNAERIIHKTLIQKSSEYAEVSKSKFSKKLIKVELWPKDSPRYFSPGIKQKWVEKA